MFTLDREAFWYFDVVNSGWKTEPGEFEILVGASSRDIREKRTVTLESEVVRVSRLHTGLTLKFLLDDPASHAVLSKYAGGFLLMADMSMAMDMTLDQIAANHPTHISQELLAKIDKDLVKIK